MAASVCCCSLFLTFALFLFFFTPSVVLADTTSSSSNISAVVAFGDSTLDAGNNNGILLSFMHADHPPYGCDFPGHVPTGRFSNGKLITDFLVSSLGIKDVLPAYLDPALKDSDLSTGVTFASAASGYDDLTARNGHVLSMGRQLEYFRDYKERLKGAIGADETEALMASTLFVVGAGSNDLMMNYYLLPTRKANFTMPQYQDFLLHNLRSFVQQVYELGGRKFTVSGLLPLGCLPFSMTGAFFTPGENMLRARACVRRQNQEAVSYNVKLRRSLAAMESTLPGTIFEYINTFDPLMDMIDRPAHYGFVEVALGCCGSGVVEMGPLCGAGESTVCPNPSDHLFWDAVHPSQRTYHLLAESLQNSSALNRLL